MRKHLPDKVPNKLSDREHGSMATNEDPAGGTRLSWKETYRAMAADREDWSDLDAAVSDGIDGEPD